jgi:hypothetical protein
MFGLDTERFHEPHLREEYIAAAITKLQRHTGLRTLEQPRSFGAS